MDTKALLPGVAILLLAGCAAPAQGPRPAPAPEPPEPPRLFFYPQQGQDAARQDRDRYECYNWAVRQTGFDPGRRPIPAYQRERIVPAPAPAVAEGAAADAQADDAARARTVVRNRRGVERYRREAADYRRAMSACLEGRGYSVR